MPMEAIISLRWPLVLLAGALTMLGSPICSAQASANAPAEATLSAEEGAKYRHVLSTGRPSQIYALAADMEEQGHPDLARKLYQTLIDRYPDDAFAAKAIDRKATLRQATQSNAQNADKTSEQGI
jgi:hypothetical protein